MMHLNRPQTLELGKLYLHRERLLNSMHQDPAVVMFSSYTACPAFVIVQDNSGEKKRCPRDDLFVLNDPGSSFSSIQSAILINWLISISESFGTFLWSIKSSIFGKKQYISKIHFKQIFP